MSAASPSVRYTAMLPKAAFVALLLVSTTVLAQTRERFERSGISLGASVRTAEQMRAFYGARGFPSQAIDAIAKTCFVTVGVYNERPDVAWLDLKQWRLLDANGKPVKRISREQWTRTWEKLNVPSASRATFGWTQLPEVRDLQPYESVGGNLAVIAPAGEFTLEARFDTGADRRGEPITISVPHLKCVVGQEAAR